MDERDRRSVDLTEIVDDPPPAPVALAPIVAHLSSPILEPRVAREPGPEPELTVPIGQIAPIAIRLAAPAIAVAVVVFVLWGLPMALLVGTGGSFSRLLGWIGSRVAFSFGDGFLGYRSDAGWPRGVQEDDEVRWQWTAATLPGASAQADRRDLPGPER